MSDAVQAFVRDVGSMLLRQPQVPTVRRALPIVEAALAQTEDAELKQKLQDGRPHVRSQLEELLQAVQPPAQGSDAENSTPKPSKKRRRAMASTGPSLAHEAEYLLALERQDTSTKSQLLLARVPPAASLLLGSLANSRLASADDVRSVAGIARAAIASAAGCSVMPILQKALGALDEALVLDVAKHIRADPRTVAQQPPGQPAAPLSSVSVATAALSPLADACCAGVQQVAAALILHAAASKAAGRPKLLAAPEGIADTDAIARWRVAYSLALCSICTQLQAMRKLSVAKCRKLVRCAATAALQVVPLASSVQHDVALTTFLLELVPRGASDDDMGSSGWQLRALAWLAVSTGFSASSKPGRPGMGLPQAMLGRRTAALHAQVAGDPASAAQARAADGGTAATPELMAWLQAQPAQTHAASVLSLARKRQGTEASNLAVALARVLAEEVSDSVALGLWQEWHAASANEQCSAADAAEGANGADASAKVADAALFTLDSSGAWQDSGTAAGEEAHGKSAVLQALQDGQIETDAEDSGSGSGLHGDDASVGDEDTAHDGSEEP